MIYILGDLHIRKEEPFYTGAKKTLDFMRETLKEGDTLIQLGDLFHSSKPFPKENSLAFDFFMWCRGQKVKVILMAGNHDYNFNQGTYSIDPFNFENIEKIYDPTLITTEFGNFFFLPWEPKKDFKNCVENIYPENYKEKIKLADYLLYHFPDETIMFGSEYAGIDLTEYEKINPNIKRIGGDIHKQSKNYLGTPYQTRYDEKGQIGHFIKIDVNVLKYEKIPQFVNYLDIKYGQLVEETSADIILTISEAPSVQIAIEEYKDYYIRLVETTTSMTRELSEEKELNSLVEALSEFLLTNKVDKKTKDYLYEVMSI